MKTASPGHRVARRLRGAARAGRDAGARALGWLKNQAPGFLVGIAVALAAQALLDFTPVYKTDIHVDLTRPPHLEMTDSQDFADESAMIFKIECRVMNRGLRPGRLTRFEIAPDGTQPTPRTEIIQFDRQLFWPWRARTIVTRALVHENKREFDALRRGPTTWRIEFFDDTGTLAFALRIRNWTPDPLP